MLVRHVSNAKRFWRAGQPLALLAAAYASIALAGPVRAGPTASDIKARLAATDTSLDIQTSFPGPKPAIVDNSAGGDSGGGRFADVFLWAAVVLGASALAVVLKDILPGGYASRASWQTMREVEATAALSKSRDDVAGTAETLAGTGRYSEAMHLLLLTSVADLRRQLDVTIADSLTSREVLHHVALSDAGKAAFADLVETVEPVHFGDRVAEAADYAACRACFDRLSAALKPGRPA